ncbi:hypothetical protein N7462_000203 [Penicillium macrosclerotiorum]|uniref:uncharacterized protein n=1 Tax=Penicillium macrosclerotiorum TaxID=303699 RepID=UPI002547B774|nr:uncharacterized protein N7462_000203 [Penicillium macrosclerotiorum]KAJ5698198.1 hypothetical protein N7462_000203 [Penicillium macrosclerotiorum]
MGAILDEVVYPIWSMLGWTFIPSTLTDIIQHIFYILFVRGKEPYPAKNSERHQRDRRIIFALVISSYLLYTLYESVYQIQKIGDFYRVLGVSPLVDERTLKSTYRRIARDYHPDRLGPGASDANFVVLQRIKDTLSDPVRRFAYDRFGPDILDWGEQQTMLDYLKVSLTRGIFKYVGGFVVMVVFSWIWFPSWGRFWRLYTFAALLALEVTLVTQAQPIIVPVDYLPAFLRPFFPWPQFYLLPFQTLTIARQTATSVYIFISKLAPATSHDPVGLETMKRVAELDSVSRANEFEAARLMQLGQAPFRGDPTNLAALRRGMEEGIILNAARSSPEVQKAIASAVERRSAAK